jgi:hypothetical protein
MAAPGGKHGGGLRGQGGNGAGRVGNAADDAKAVGAQGGGEVKALAGAAQEEEGAGIGVEAIGGEAGEAGGIAAGAGDIGVAVGAGLGGGGVTDGEQRAGGEAGGEAVGAGDKDGLGGGGEGWGAAGDGEDRGDDGGEAAFGEAARGFAGAGFGPGDEDCGITGLGRHWWAPVGRMIGPGKRFLEEMPSDGRCHPAFAACWIA